MEKEFYLINLISMRISSYYTVHSTTYFILLYNLSNKVFSFQSYYICYPSYWISYLIVPVITPIRYFIFTIYVILFQWAFYPNIQVISPIRYLISLYISSLLLGILSHDIYPFQWISYPTIYIISLSILSHYALHSTEHLIILYMSLFFIHLNT